MPYQDPLIHKVVWKYKIVRYTTTLPPVTIRRFCCILASMTEGTGNKYHLYLLIYRRLIDKDGIIGSEGALLRPTINPLLFKRREEKWAVDVLPSPPTPPRKPFAPQFLRRRAYPETEDHICRVDQMCNFGFLGGVYVRG